MPYPFTSWPSYAGFVGRAVNEFGASLSVLEGVIGPRGPVVFHVLELNGKSAILPEDDGHPLGPSVVRSLCRQLGIPVEAFGFTLGDWDEGSDIN